MIDYRNLLSEEQKQILEDLDMLYNIDDHSEDINKINSLAELEDYKERVKENGVFALNLLQRSTSRTITQCERKIAQLQAQLREEQYKAELYRELVETDLNKVFDAACRKRKEELDNVEYEKIYKISKSYEYRRKHSMEKKTVIEIRVFRSEKGNIENRQHVGLVAKLEWKDRGRIADILKDKDAQQIVVHEPLFSKRLEKEFDVIRVIKDSEEF